MAVRQETNEDRAGASTTNILVAELIISMLLDKLQVYYQNYPEEAQMAAKRMIRILQVVDTDDDFFPSGQIAAIQSITHSDTRASKIKTGHT